MDGDDGGVGPDCGTINIFGGNVYAYGDCDSSDSTEGGAGIGSGTVDASASAEIVQDIGPAKGTAAGEDVIDISGNCTVVAGGGAYAAGIGGGASTGPKSVTISVDGECRVDATGGKHAAGIGGGSGSKGDGKDQTVNCGISGAITINSGIVTAIGGAGGGSGIGSGAGCGDPAFNTVDVTVNGGTVTATAGDMGNEVGAGKYDSGVAIGAGGQYLKSELNNIEIDDDFAERK